MIETRVSAKTVVQEQIPLFMQEEYPLFAPFLKQYYESEAHFSSPINIVKNIDQLLKVGTYTSEIINVGFTTVTQPIDYTDTTIYVESTATWPSKYGLLKIDDEIITYTSLGSTFFGGCIRGFSGITTYSFYNKNVSYETTELDTHEVGSKVENLSVIFLQQFYKKLKYQILPGFENFDLNATINQQNLIRQAKDFYSSKGTSDSNNILFKALYGEECKTIKPQDYLLKPSANDYRLVKQIVIKPIIGDPLTLIGNSLFQEVESDSGIKTNYGSISNVEVITDQYYQLDIDYGYNRDIRTFGTIFGKFVPHPKTKLIGIGNSTLIVDSTVGFAQTGSLIVENNIVYYNDKTTNQFLQCVGIGSFSTNADITSASIVTYGFDKNGKRIDVEIVSILEKLNQEVVDFNYFFDGDPVLIKSLGIIKEKSDSRFNSWKFNTSIKYNPKSITFDGQYFIVTTHNDHLLFVNDDLQFIDKNSNAVILGRVEKIISDTKFKVSADLNRNENNLELKYYVKRLLKTYESNQSYTTDIQNVYDLNQDAFVTSPSIPSYQISANTRTKSAAVVGLTTTKILNIQNHGFYSGDLVKLDFDENDFSNKVKTYFVKKIDKDSINLALSNSNIDNHIYEDFYNQNQNVSVISISPIETSERYLKTQKLVRKIPKNPTDSLEKNIETIPGRRLGILINGVEILNYKSKECVYHGPIESIDVLDGGYDYDIINPPIISIEDSTGVGATGNCAVIGSLQEIKIIDGGFDYIDVPTISISGGNGVGAKAEAKITKINHDIYFNATGVATALGGFIDISSNIIGFNTEHKLNLGEEVLYNSIDRLKIGIGSTAGDSSTKDYLQDDSAYYVSIVDDTKIKLHKDIESAVAKIDEINLTSVGEGIQRFRSTRKKNIITSINIIDPGSRYENKKRIATPTGINTSNNTINIKNHDYKTGEIITYKTSGSVISGLSTTENYYVIKIDDDRFRLASAGIGTTSSNFNYLTNQYVNISSIGSGEHQFNYPEISVTISGKIGVSRTDSSKYESKIIPVFRGKISSIQVTNGGSGYGSTDIINFDKQPKISLKTGENAVITPIIKNQKISEIIVLNSGNDYNSLPSFNFEGFGSRAQLTPIIENGKLISVKVINGGVGFTTGTDQIIVESSGKSSARLKANIKKWTVNLVEKYKDIFSQSDDDGIIVSGIRSDLQYVNLFAPRNLRKQLPSKNIDGSNNYSAPDLIFSNVESLSNNHSPIIGWAYDGNPIYGPYGYETIDGSQIKALSSGYEIVSYPDRPPGFSLGFFVDDYAFTNVGDLDQHNGRFCKTPDFPNGTYAYFCTINGNESGFDQTYSNYRRPSFPYVIGNTYKSSPIEFNFLPSSNQNDFDLLSDNYIRNTYPYKLNDAECEYESIFQPQKRVNQRATIDSSYRGSVESVGIISAGYNYKVGDIVVFNNEGTSGDGSSARISEVFESRISSLSAYSTKVDNVEFSIISQNGIVEGISSTPHGLKNLDTVNISGISSEFFIKFAGNKKINVTENQYVISSGIGTTGITGIVTNINILGTINKDLIQPDDVLKITNPGVGTEKLLVLSIDPVFNRIRVKREHNGTVGYSYSAFSTIQDDPRRFTYESGISTEKSEKTKKLIYFNPSESVAIGTVGSGATITYSIGSSSESKFIRLQSIYIENHELSTNQKVLYSNEGGNSIIGSSNGINTTPIQNNSILYIAKFNNNLIGLSTLPLGIGSTGGFSGIGTDAQLLYFHSYGSGVYHKFTTQDEIITGFVEKNIGIITCQNSHDLKVGNSISLDVLPGITTTILIKYNPENRRLVANTKYFSTSGVSTSNSTIRINNHNYKTGDKVIYSSTNPANGLENNQIYYVFKVDENKIKLTESLYQTTIPNPQYVSIGSSGSDHQISSVNPPIDIVNGNTVIFDLSDSTLSDVNGGVKVQSFDFDLYTDSTFTDKFITSLSSPTFEVNKTGIIGVTNDAKLTLKVTDALPNKLYYKLTPLIGKSYLSKEKSEIILDEDVIGFNEISYKKSAYNDNYVISGIGSTSFTFNLNSYPEYPLYDSSNSVIKYKTNQIGALGSISKIEILFGGKAYSSPPGITSIRSGSGYGAILSAQSSQIGKILKSSIQTPGFNYPYDKTLKPIAQLPQRLLVNQLYSINSVGLSSGGKNYSVPPDFVVIDSVTNEIKDEVILKAEVTTNKVSKVDILKNTKTLYGTPRVLAINNSNGIGVTDVSYNQSTKIVTLNLASGFSTARDFPFSVGSKILVEGIGISSSGAGYNSSQYGYELFTLIGVTSAIGGTKGVLQYKLDTGKNPGIFSKQTSLQNGSNSYGRVVPESYLPTFDPSIKFGEFTYNEGENVFVENENVGKIVSWDPTFNLLKINNSSREIKPGEILRGGSTDNRSTVVFNYKSYGDFSVGSTNEKLKDYSGEVGKLNTYSQVLQDGNYYQNFSYSLKSKVSIDKWSDSVDALTHTLGYKKFSDLQIESSAAGAGATILSSNTNVLIDIIERKDFDCYEDFAFAKESAISFDKNLVSNEISFDTLRLLDYTEFVTNRVLSIDDISDQFDDTPSIFNYAVISSFDITKYYAGQFYILIKDSRYFGEKEIVTVNIIYDGNNGYLTSYAANKTLQDLGKFSFRRFGSLGQILFYPTKYEYNSYNFGNAYIGIANTVAGISTVSLGDVVSFGSSSVYIPASLSPNANTVVSISTSNVSSAKILVSASGDNDEFQFSEINVISNGNQCEYVIFGEIDSGTSTPTYGEGSVGMVGVTTSTNGISITFTPVSNVNVTVNSLSISIGNTSTVGVATTVFYYGELSSHYTSIGSTSSPVATRIAGFTTSGLDKHDGATYYMQITDTTNNQIRFSEVSLINDSDNQSHIEEFAVLTSDGLLGNIGAESTSTHTYLTFTPDPNINIEARVFQKSLQISPKQTFGEINLNNSTIESNTNLAGFEGTQISLKKDFNLKHKGSPIFKKIVDGSSSTIVDINNNSISIPNHFFITGEKIEYSVDNNGSRIGIATTTIAGIGTTTQLPSTLYAVKISDNLVKFAETPEKALRFNPEVFDITSIGVGNSHIFKSNYKSNSKSLITIDNIIQSPIVATAKTTYLISNSDDVNTTSIFEVNNPKEFYATDLLKIDDEFVIVTDVGIGATNRIACKRSQLGTQSAIHATGSIVTKYSGNYNIVDDVIYFVSSPHGDSDGTINENTSHFHGRIFLRSQPTGSAVSAYYENNIFDDISEKFDGKKSTFTLKNSGMNVSGIVSSNSVSAGILLINNIFQKPKYPATGVGQTFTYEVIENAGISSVVFSGNSVGLTTNNVTGPMKFDVNSAGIPRGGIIVSVGSTQGIGFQPLVSAGGTAIVSAAGTIQSISIGNSGSGYRPGIQTSIVVSIATSEGNLSIGTATALNGNIVSIAVTYVGSGYTTSNPPKVIIDSPLNYENIPLVYDSSNSGIGTEAAVDIVVGYGNSILQFNITNSGYGYSVGDTLTFEIGGSTGIPTNTNITYSPFQISVSETFTDQFNCWYPGQFVVLDDFSNDFDGFKKIFTLKENGVVSNFVVKGGSPIQLDRNLLIFVNDTLQIPGESYEFNGGSQIEFLEAPKSGDTVKALFYKGSDSDVREVSVSPTIKIGDSLKLIDQLRSIKNFYTENERIVTEVSVVDSVYTTQYFGPGITSDASIIRTVEWCKQKDDFYIDEVLISKSRPELSANIFPVSNLIRPIGIASTSIFVQNVRPLFNYTPEILPSGKQNIRILDQSDARPAIATAIVSAAGTISQILVLDGGIGFSTSPAIIISLSSSGSSSIATCNISGIGTISSIDILTSGFGYTSTNPPQVLISIPAATYEDITGVNYEGDFGIISGIGTTSIAGVSTGITFDFYIPKDSIFRDSTQVGTSLTISGIQTGYYFVVYDSTVGNGLTSINDDTSILGIGSTYIDNIYQAFSVKAISGNAVGVGNTTELIRVTTSVTSYNNLSGIGNSQFFGYFSWGRLFNFNRGANPKSFSVNLENGLSGISTAPLIIRSTPMRSLYTS